MPTTINGMVYNMESIAQLAEQKFELAKQAERLLKQLRKTFYTDKKFEETQVMSEKKSIKLQKKREYMAVTKLVNNEWIALIRDKQELVAERQLLATLTVILDKMEHIAGIEVEYFRHYVKT